MIVRKYYLDKIRPYLGKPVVKAIGDNYLKIIISAEKVCGDDLRGIRVLSLKDFLLNRTETFP